MVASEPSISNYSPARALFNHGAFDNHQNPATVSENLGRSIKAVIGYEAKGKPHEERSWFLDAVLSTAPEERPQFT